MQKVRSHYFLILLELLIKLLIPIFPLGTLHYHLYVIFSLREKFPYIQTVFDPFYFFYLLIICFNIVSLNID